MKNADFVALLTANAAKTKNVRCYSKVWPSGARRVPTHILYKIGSLVSFIQAKINEGIFCDPSKDGLLIYNFQPAMVSSVCQFCTIDALLVPVATINTTWELKGTPVHLAVNLSTFEVVNNTQSMVDLGLITAEEVFAEGLESPVSYGRYTDYEPTTSFVAFVGDTIINSDVIFTGAHNNSDFIQNALFFDSHVETQEYLQSVNANFKLIGEITGPKSQASKMVKEGLSNYLLKVISPTLDNIRGTSNKEVRKLETRIEDEITMLLTAHKEDALIPGDEVKISSPHAK